MRHFTSCKISFEASYLHILYIDICKLLNFASICITKVMLMQKNVFRKFIPSEFKTLYMSLLQMFPKAYVLGEQL